MRLNFGRGHWFLLILCHFGEDSEANSQRRCMLLLDSLQKAHSKQLEPEIRRYFLREGNFLLFLYIVLPYVLILFIYIFFTDLSLIYSKQKNGQRVHN